MSDTQDIKLGRLSRDQAGAAITIARAADSGPVQLSFSLSSETPVQRWFGTEVLSHKPGAVRLDRMKAGAAPLLFNHNWDDPVGMIDAARLQDGRLVVDAHLFDTPRAREVASMIDGGLRNVSIGYEILEMTEDAKRQTFTATDWMPLEGSIVTVPADPSVGLGRAAEETARPVRIVRTADSQPAAPAANPQEKATMAETTIAAAGTSADEVHNRAATVPATPRGGPSGTELEGARQRAIKNLCQANNIPDATERMWITSGMDMEEVSKDLLGILEARGKDDPKSSAALGLSGGEAKRYSIFNAIRAVADKDWSKAGFELECTREIAKRLGVVQDPNKFYVPFEVQQRQVPMRRDLTAGTANAGGYVVETQNLSFIEILRNRSVAYRMGARRLSGLQGNVTIPRQTAAATAYWLSTEATTITESQQTFGQLSLTPKNVGAYTEISRQLMLQSSPDAEALVTADLGQVAALAIDSAVISGSGASGQPTGIVNTAGIDTGTAASIAFSHILGMQTAVAGANVMPAAGGFATTPTVAALLMQRVKFTSTASPLWEGNLWDGSMMGFPAMSSLQMAAGTALFGDWQQVVVGEWGVLQVEVNPYANFQAGIVGVRAIVTVDVGVRYAGAFSYRSSIT